MPSIDDAYRIKLIREALARFPDARHVLIEDGTTGTKFSEVEPPSEDLRTRARKHGLPLIEGDGFVAISQYDSGKDITTYRIARE